MSVISYFSVLLEEFVLANGSRGRVHNGGEEVIEADGQSGKLADHTFSGRKQRE